MTAPDMAVTVVEQSTADAMVEWTLDEFPVEQFNRLIPTQTLSIPTDLLRPVVQVVQLNPDTKSGGDVYASKDMPAGHAAPTKVGLRKLATAAGISIIDERRTDDGRDSDVIEVTCLAEMLLPTGQRLRAIGQKRIDLNAQVWSSPEHRGKYKSFFLEHVASRAENRAIRALLSLKGSYPADTYRKPFAVVSFAPNMAHPEVRARFLDSFAPALSAGYGPAASSTPPRAAGAPVTEVPEAPDDDAPAVAPVPRAMPGERLRAASGRRVAPAPDAEAVPEEPDWMQDARPVAEAAHAGEPGIRDIVAARLADEGQPKGPMNRQQQESIARIFALFGEARGSAFAAGVEALLGTSWRDLTCAQARAIAMTHDELGSEAFIAAWRELVA